MKNNLSIHSQFLMSDWAQMDEFIAATHGDGHVLRNRALFDWFFLRNPDRNLANLIVAYEGGKLISVLGYLPTRFRWGDETVTGAWMAHWVTRPGYRSGIGALLMRKITEMFPIVAGQGASLMNQQIVTKMKFLFLERIPKAACVFNQDKVEQAFNFKAPATRSVGTNDAAIEVTELTRKTFDPDWDLYPSLRYGTLRDSEYLKHRYIDYPFFRYSIFVEGGPKSPAVLIARIIDTAVGIRVARVLEFFFPENTAGRRSALSLVKKSLNFFEQRDCDYADFYCTSNTHMSLMMEAHFFHEDTGALPSLLDPIDMSRKHQNLELFVSSGLRKKYPGAENDFLATRADGDQDRPNESFSKAENGMPLTLRISP